MPHKMTQPDSKGGRECGDAEPKTKGLVIVAVEKWARERMWTALESRCTESGHLLGNMEGLVRIFNENVSENEGG